MSKLTLPVSIAVLCIATVLFVSCRKTDQQNLNQNQLERDLEKKFFSRYEPNDPAIVSLANFVKRQNDKHNFIPLFVKSIGLPHWNKALIFGTSAQTISGRGGTTSTDSIIYCIPFSRDSQQYVNASLLIKIKDTDTTFRMLYDWQYRYFGFEQSDSTRWNARNVFQMFTMMDREVFGTTQFKIIDLNLLAPTTRAGLIAQDYNLDSLEITFTMLPDESRTAGRYMAPITVCVDYEVCIKRYKAFRSSMRGPEAQGSEMPCYEWGIQTECTTYWVDIGGGSGGSGSGPGSGSGSGSGSGGGGGGGGWTNPNPNPPPCPSPPVARLVQPDPGGDPCNGGNGWTPVPTTFAQAVDQVTNNLTDPCKNAALASITNAKIKNFVTSYYNRFLKPIDSRVNITLKEGNNLTVSNQTVPAYSVESAENSWEIVLSSNYFAPPNYNMSREAWGVIIAHELLHLVITEENLNELGSQYDHMFIFTSFVEPVRDLLVEAFGITESDALKLSLSGINDLWAYGDFEQLCTTRYGVSFTAMNNTLDSYTKGTGGTKCN